MQTLRKWYVLELRMGVKSDILRPMQLPVLSKLSTILSAIRSFLSRPDFLCDQCGQEAYALGLSGMVQCGNDKCNKVQ